MQSIIVKLHLLKLSFSTGWIVPSLNSREGPGPEVHSARWIHCSVQALAWTVCIACTTLCTILPNVLNALVVVQCSVFSGGACTGREINDRSRRPQDTCQVSRGGCTATIQCSVIHITHILSLCIHVFVSYTYVFCVCEHNHFPVCQDACIFTINCTDLRWIVKYNFW